jgi:hypothetical protein
MPAAPHRRSYFKVARKRQQRQRGFALPVAIGIGMCLLLLGLTITTAAQNDRNLASQRRQTSTGFLVAEGGVDKVMAQLSNSNNAVLLAHTYDPINLKTGRTYLGADGVPNSGDEGTVAVDEWTGYNPSTLPCYQQVGWAAPTLPLALTGTIGSGSYTLRAYRYDPNRQQGILIVEGNYRGASAALAITITVKPDLDDFPSLIAVHSFPGHLYTGRSLLRGRNVLGRNGNLYYAPSQSADSLLVGNSAPGDTDRPGYLNAIWSGPSDGAIGDTVSGKLFACKLTPTLPRTPQGVDLGIIDSSQTVSGIAGSISHYRVQNIQLANSETLTVDTTAGPVYLYLTAGNIQLNNTAKILNVRSDGRPPRVGDLRILVMQIEDSVLLYDQTCIQNAFLYSYYDNLELYTTGPGCPGGRNTSFEGVVWAEVIASSKNAATNRNVAGLSQHENRFNSIITPGATAGIAVPDDLSSLVDLLQYIDWPARYRFGAIKNWQQVRL